MSTVENDGRKLIACQLCRVMVASITEHEGSARHQAARQLAAAALDRLRAHLAPRTTLRDDVTANLIAAELNPDINQVFCGACSSNIPVSEKNHWRCKAHLMDALNEQILDELVREYVEDEDLPLMGAPSKDPSDVETGKVVGNCEVVEKYKCYLCDVLIPTVFRTEHELSVRHRANLACANAASRRIRAHLVPTGTTILPPETSIADKITPLLKVYVKHDMKDKPEMFLENKEKAKETGTVAKATAETRLTAKKYFTEVQKHLHKIGDFYGIVIDDTEYVTVKSGKNTLNVHVADFNGVYYVGDQMKCRMCDHNNFHVSYSSGKQHDKIHVMSLGHIARMLTPINNVHGIRKIDNTHYFCIICNVSLPSSDAVKKHIASDIEHTALLPEALERGNAFKESKDDLKITFYGQGTSNIPKHHSSYSTDFSDTQTAKLPNRLVFGQTFGATCQTDANSNLFGSSSNSNTVVAKSNSNTAFGSSTQQITSQPNQNMFKAKSNTQSYQNTVPGALGQICSVQPTENATPLPKFGTTSAFRTSQTGNLPNQNTPATPNLL